MLMSLSKAATETGLSKSTLSRAIKSGRMSAQREGQGYLIDAAELFRVYPKGGSNGGNSGPMMHHATAALADETPTLKAEIEGLRAQLELMRDRFDDMRSDRDVWRDQAQVAQRQADTAQRLLADQRQQAPATTPARRGFFGWRKAG